MDSQKILQISFSSLSKALVLSGVFEMVGLGCSGFALSKDLSGLWHAFKA
jgi:hypothetical protein